MDTYDFLVLSSHEFENISKDLLQKRLSVFIESFTTGRDGGIDLRCARPRLKNTIIQAKRYKDYTSLFNNLKIEVAKVRKLDPDSYIITTSVGLTPANKDQLKSLFYPFIKNTSDILGKEDLNNLLSLNGDIELKYYKLWLSSTRVLEKVLHSKIYNQSAFELEEIREQVKLYVQNDSFKKALAILNDNRYVIVSGIPGIGKTTLSRILILYLLSNGYEDFVYLSQSIDEGYELFKDGKKQIFFFDDFLGKNLFDTKQSTNEDSRIVKFIEKIKRSRDKLLILATREYILNQAKNAYETFRINNIEIGKCVLDLSYYTNLIKAQIVYNHLFFAEVPVRHLEDLVTGITDDPYGKKKYFSLISHPNYNPRIIETVIKRKLWEHCRADQFALEFKSFLDNPESVWLFAFENSLDKFSQYAIIVLLSMGTPVLIVDWEEALKELLMVNANKFQISYDSIKFERALRELENTFIKTQKDSYTTIAVGYQNPSIQDFLVNYLKDKKDLSKSILESALFTDQFFSVFTTALTDDVKESRKILLDAECVDIAVTRLHVVGDRLRSCHAEKHVYKKNDNLFFWSQNGNFKYEFLERVYKEFSGHDPNVLIFVYSQFQKNIYIDDLSYSEQRAYIHLLEALDRGKLSFNEETLIESHLFQIKWLENLEIFHKMEAIFPELYRKTVSGERFRDKVVEIVAAQISSVEDSDLEALRGQLEAIKSLYSLSLEEELGDIERREKDYSDYLDQLNYDEIEDRTGDFDRLGEMSEGKVIEEIFNSLVDR